MPICQEPIPPYLKAINYSANYSSNFTYYEDQVKKLKVENENLKKVFAELLKILADLVGVNLNNLVKDTDNDS